MQGYVLRRLLVSVFVILGVTLIAFASVHLIPGDVVDVKMGTRRDPESRATLRERLGLDQPPLHRYVQWLGGLLRGDLGRSLQTEEPVATKIRQRLPVTIELTILASLIAMLVGIPTGIIAAVRQYSFADQVSTLVSVIGLSMPSFWLATLLVLSLSVTWRLLPPSGALPGFFDDPVANLRRMLMPALSIGLPSAAAYFRMTRSSMLEVIHSEYIVTAYSKGLRDREVIVGHALKNAFVPVVTVSALQVTWMLGGSFIIETIFSLPGLGRATIDAIYERDYTVLQGCLLVYCTVVVLISIATDLVYAWLDPRIRYE